MATEILRPQDCLIQRIRVPPASFSRRRSYANNNNNCNYNYYYNHSNHHAVSSRSSSRKPVTRPDQRKRVVVGQPVAEAAPVLKRTSADDSRVARSSGFAMEKVTILRRGQSLDSMAAAAAVTSDMYAGSACAVSPSPSALPLPSFPTKKRASPAAAAVDDSATRDLRRLLRLE